MNIDASPIRGSVDSDLGNSLSPVRFHRLPCTPEPILMRANAFAQNYHSQRTHCVIPSVLSLSNWETPQEENWNLDALVRF